MIPELALPKKRAVPDSDFPLAIGGDILKLLFCFFLRWRVFENNKKGCEKMNKQAQKKKKKKKNWDCQLFGIDH